MTFLISGVAGFFFVAAETSDVCPAAMVENAIADAAKVESNFFDMIFKGKSSFSLIILLYRIIVKKDCSKCKSM